ncbi:hypothetical protein CTI12_AA342830 [Artemisia annua]|uniref:CASP-like protein n=1 Tax=Artemisia annua TaxID=35608 RepID=A0A2U1MT89_ARTAN|nr:hypothetical protein CTI12_AA342830 [Artemisia annua]
MDLQYKEGINNGRIGGVKRTDLALRLLALVLTLTAAVVLGVNKQVTTVAITLSPSLPPVKLPVTAKWHYMSAFVYFVIVNAVACAYTALSLVLTLATKGGKKNVSSIGAVGLIGYEGNSHVEWQKKTSDLY